MLARRWPISFCRITHPPSALLFSAEKAITAAMVLSLPASCMSRGKKVQVILLADSVDLKGDAATMFGKLPLPAIPARSSDELKSDKIGSAMHADLYLDAILGTGFKPPVSGLYADAIALMNASRVPMVAIDIPSGADADPLSCNRELSPVPTPSLPSPPRVLLIFSASSLPGRPS